MKNKKTYEMFSPVGMGVTSPSVQEVWASISGPAEWMQCRRRATAATLLRSLKTMCPRHYDAEMDPATRFGVKLFNPRFKNKTKQLVFA